jgi:hypothetical protein
MTTWIPGEVCRRPSDVRRSLKEGSGIESEIGEKKLNLEDLRGDQYPAGLAARDGIVGTMPNKANIENFA